MGERMKGYGRVVGLTPETLLLKERKEDMNGEKGLERDLYDAG